MTQAAATVRLAVVSFGARAVNLKTCPPVSALSDWLAGRAPDSDDGPMAAHLEGCPSCREAASRIESGGEPLLHGLKGLRPGMPTEGDLPQTLAKRLRQLPAGSPEPDEAPALPAGRIPKRLRDYELLEPIGAGGMGRVYKARHRRLGRLFAVKLLPSRAKDRVERFRRESAALGPLDHPNVVRATDAGEAGGVMYLAMEYVEGADAERLVRHRGPLPIAEACDIARQAALGLQHLHEAGLVHRDVKPANLMVTPTGVVRLLDLGLAASEDGGPDDRLTRDGAVLGTPDYLAPEQARNPRSADRRADLYALGCTLYHLLVGEAPFGDRGRVAKLLAHHGEEPTAIEKLRPEVPKPLASLLGKLMAKNPDERPATAAEVATALAPFCAAAPVAKRPRHILLAGAAAVGILGLAAWAFRDTDATPAPRDESTTTTTVDGPARRADTSPAASGSGAAAAALTRLEPHTQPVAEQPTAAESPDVGWFPPTPQLGETAKPAAEGTPLAADATPRAERGPRQALVGAVAPLTGHTQPVIAIAFAPDGTRAVSAGGHQFEPVITWDLGKRRSAGEQRPGPTVDAAFLPTMPTRVALAVGYMLELWDLGGEKPVARLGHESLVTSLAVASDTASAATGTDRGRATVWDLAGERRVAELPLNRPITAVAISADGTFVAAATNDGSVHLWNVTADRIEHVLEGHHGSVLALAFSSDAKLWVGERFAPGRPGDDQRALVYDLKTFATDHALVIAEPGRLVSDVALHPASGHAVVGHNDGTLSVWNVSTGDKLHHDGRHSGQITGLAISADGKAALSGGNDAKLWLWDLAEMPRE